MHRKWNKGQVPLRSGSFWWRSKTRETDNWHRSYSTSHMGRCIFFYNHATGWPASRRVKIIQFADGKTNLFLCLSFVFWYTIFWKKYEKSEGADPISVTSSANALKEGSRRALCFYRITPVNKFLIFFSSSKLLIFGRINIGDIS